MYICGFDGYVDERRMPFLDPFNLAMWFVVLSFWTTVMLLSRARRGRVSSTLLVIPAFFLLVGTLVNRMHPHPPWGTYAILLIHVMMLPALLRVAKSKP
jgi:hypothetical protein